MERERRLVAFATLMAAILFPVFAVFAVIFLSEGKIVSGLILLASVAVGTRSLVAWRRQFR
ncbi:MAG: hypothetical protein M3N16_03380 [Actinomycetota bacterium]|nr:hypothetical protein [Actinomycetota bacterium]